jgi:hypothetical protein
MLARQEQQHIMPVLLQKGDIGYTLLSFYLREEKYEARRAVDFTLVMRWPSS